MELYLHIPYCKQKCRYCDFASWAGREDTMSAYVDAVLAEADALATDAPLQTAFIGGGTPSILPAPLLNRLLGGLRERFRFTPGMEFTTEANPGTLTEAWLETALSHGVNRLSMGMQAAQPELLQTLGRIHRFEDVEASVRLAQRMGMAHISVDLMFGLPGQTPAMWRESLDAALSLGVEHLSCYGLIPEDGTPLKRDLDAGRLFLPDEEDERRMYDDALRILDGCGFRQYEISNFAKPGCECRHNIGYWQQIPYIGLGASAASMLPAERGYVRTANPPRITDYIAMVSTADWSRRETTPVSPADARFETLMLGLRMTEGVSEADFLRMHGVTLEGCCGSALRSLEARGLLLHRASRWALTRRGMDVQNAVLVELMEALEAQTD